MPRCLACNRRKKYKPLEYPLMPCVIVGSLKRPDWVPLELCQVVPGAGEDTGHWVVLGP